MIDPHSATLDEIFEDMIAKRVEYTFHASYSYSHICFINISGKYDGMEIACKESIDLKKERASDGVRRAYAKFLHVAGAGAPAMLAPPIEAQPARIAASDDLSF